MSIIFQVIQRENELLATMSLLEIDIGFNKLFFLIESS
jgi:hypothetical protein